MHSLSGDSTKRRKLAALAFHRDQQSRRKARDSRRGRDRRERILYEACPKRVVGGVGPAWHGFEQAVSGDGTLAHRGFRSTIPNAGGWYPKQDVLRDGVSRYCNRSAGSRRSIIRLSVACYDA